MITFERDATRFTYRVAGVALSEGRVLLCRVDGYDWWFLPGGRAELGETSTETLVREMREELGAVVQVERLLWVAEVMYIGEITGQAQHELGLYFLMRFAPDSPLYRRDTPFAGEEHGIRLIFAWHEVATLDRVRLYPLFLREGLQAPPVAVTHLIVRE